MSIPTVSRLVARVAGRVPLRTVLIVPFVLQIVGTVGLVGYLSYRNGQQAVEDLAYQLIDEVDERVEQNLQHYLDVPKHINQNLAAAIRTRVLNWKNFSGLERYFAQQLQVYDTVSNVAIATEQKEFLAVEKSLASDGLIIRVLNKSTNYAFHYYAANGQGQRIKLTKVRHDYNPHRDPPKGRPWYQAVQEAGQAIWLPVVNLSQGVDHPLLTMVNFLPFDDPDGNFQGVLAAALYLPHFASFLEQLEIGQTGQVFIIDRQGLLIASSTGETPFKQNLNSDYLKNLNPQEWRMVAQNSRNSLTQASVKFLLTQVKNLHQIEQHKNFEFDFHHHRHFLKVNPIPNQSELDWLIITVVPEADFMTQINAKTRTTILLCILALIGSTGIGIIIARWITKPILRLNTAAKDIAKGEWEKTVESERTDEVGELAKSFNQMAAQLQQSFAELKSLNAALAQSESKLNQILEAIPVGVSVHDITGKLIYANQTSRQLLGIETLPDAETEQLAEVYHVYQAGTEQLYPLENMPVVRSLQGERARVEDMEIRLPDRTIPLEVYSTPLFDETGEIVAAIAAFFDITHRQQAEQLLANYHRTLETQVAEQTAELTHANAQLRMEIAGRNLLEGKLYSSTQQVRTIFESITDIVLIIDEQRSIQIIPTKTMSGYISSTNLLNSIVEQFFQQEDTEESWFAQAQQVLATQQSINFDFSLRIDNREVWFTACLSPLPDNSVVWVARDISDRKQAEEALRESEKRYRELFEKSVDGIVFTDMEGRFLTCNVSYQKMLGYSIEELQQKTYQEITPSKWYSMEVEIVEKQIIARGYSDTYEKEYIRKDGTIFPVEINAYSQKNEAGQPETMWAIVRDMSARKIAEQALQASQARFAGILEIANDAIITVDAAQRITLFNQGAEKMFGYTALEVLGQPLDLLLPTRVRDIHRQHVTAFNESVGKARRMGERSEIFARRKDGTEFPAEASISKLEINGEIICTAILRDISERKQAQQALQESQARLEKLTNNVPGSIYGLIQHPDGSINFEYVSSAVREIHELEPEQVLENATLVLEHMHPDDQASYSLAVEISIQTLELFQHQWRIITPSGKVKWLQAQSKPERRSNGDIVWYGVVFDITDKKQSEAALRRYERIVSATADAMSLVDRNYIYQVVNQTYLTWHNKQYEEIIGHSVSELLGADVFENGIKERLDQCLAGETVQCEAWFELAVGRQCLSVTYSPYLEADQTISGVVVSLRDITELKQTEEALRQMNQEMQAIFAAFPDILFRLAGDGTILDYKTKNEQNLYTPPETFLGKKLQDVLPPDVAQKLHAEVRQVLQTDSPVSVEYSLPLPDGEQYFEARMVRFQENEVIALTRNISDRKRAELALQEREYSLRTLADNLPNGLIYQLVQEPNGKIYFSHITAGIERLVGIKPEVVMQDASVLHNFIVEEDRLLNEQLTEESRRNLSIFQMQMRKRTPTGEIQWSYVRSAPRRLDDGRTVWDGIEIDITNLKQAEAELAKAKEAAEAANRAKSQFLANMSHELRTPLNGILGYAQILQRDKNCTPKQQDGINIIYKCGTHLLTLINDILDLSKIEAEKVELYPEDFNFPSFLQGLSEIFRIKAAQKEINFTYLNLTQLPKTIHADEKRLRQVLMNLLSNAIKFTDTGTVTFKVEVISHQSLVNDQGLMTNDQELMTNAKIRFQIEDTGIGITPEHLEKIFLPFEQVGDSSRRSEGTGLGLAITQKLVAMMGSEIFVESIPGVGSKFWFDLDLPEVSTFIELTPATSIDTIIGYEGKKRKILVVDDRWENCAVIINILEPLGFELLEASNGQEGLEKAVEFQPDLILVDLIMPVMDGFQMTRQLRQLSAFQDTIVMAISANAFEFDRLHSLQSGCNDFLPKPVQAEDLLTKIKSYLNLTWIYDQQGTGDWEGLSTGIRERFTSRQSLAPTPSDMVIPPAEELFALSQAAQIGDVAGVEQEIFRLQQLTPEYAPFVTRILELAEDFEYEEIVKIVDRYLAEDS